MNSIDLAFDKICDCQYYVEFNKQIEINRVIPTQFDSSGNTLFHKLLYIYKNSDINERQTISYLVTASASDYHVNGWELNYLGKTIMELAIEFSASGIAEFFINRNFLAWQKQLKFLSAHGSNWLNLVNCEYMAKILIGAGADVNLKSADGFYPIHSAATKSKRILQIFLDAGANAKTKNVHGQTAIEIAVANNCFQNAKILEKYL